VFVFSPFHRFSPSPYLSAFSRRRVFSAACLQPKAYLQRSVSPAEGVSSAKCVSMSFCLQPKACLQRSVSAMKCVFSAACLQPKAYLQRSVSPAEGVSSTECVLCFSDTPLPGYSVTLYSVRVLLSYRNSPQLRGEFQ
jgi:hypothetical protein